MSPRSARRLAFLLSNAPKDWGVMATLTFRTMPTWPKDAFRRFWRLLGRRGLTGCQWCWVMEFQARGAVHFHVLWEKPWLIEKGFLHDRHLQVLARRGKRTTVLRGPFDAAIVGAWCDAVGDRSLEFGRFQAGGIVEVLQSEDGASRYFSNYLAKKEQKELPESIQGAGRWWCASPSATPKVESSHLLTHVPRVGTFRMIYDRSHLDGCITERQLNGCLTDREQPQKLGPAMPRAEHRQLTWKLYPKQQERLARSAAPRTKGSHGKKA